VLRWDERAIYALRISLYMFERVPWIGEYLVLLVLGGPEISTLTLTRLYSVHVIFVPLLLLAFVGHHLYLVILHGTTASSEREHPSPSKEAHQEMYEREAQSPTHGEMFYPRTIARLMPLPAAMFILALVLTLTLRGGRLFPEANLTQTSFPYEEWWWAWFSSLAALLPPWLAPTFYVAFPVGLFLLLLGLPFIDRGPSRGLRKRPIAVSVVLLVIVGLVYLSGLRRTSPWTAWPDAVAPPVPEGVVLAEGPERGRQLFATYGCNSCHAVAGHGRPFGPDLAALRQRYSNEELRQYILRPPAGVAMPAYEGHITEDDLRWIVEYVLVAQTFAWRSR
jgi:ubiquinol-cytochrome c reductase cytochrome b subunit